MDLVNSDDDSIFKVTDLPRQRLVKGSVLFEDSEPEEDKNDEEAKEGDSAVRGSGKGD